MGDQQNKVSRHAESLRTQYAPASKIMQLTAHLLGEQAARGRASSVLKHSSMCGNRSGYQDRKLYSFWQLA